MKKMQTTPGERIRGLREDRGYTRDYLSEATGISTKFLFEIETNKKGFSAYTLMKISNVLEVSMDYIMTGQLSFDCKDEIAVTLEQFKPHTLEAIEKLLKIAYDIANDK